MSKEENGIKGWELLKMISEGKIKDGDMFDVILPLTKAVACKAMYCDGKLFLVSIDGTLRITLSLYYSDKQLASFIFEKIEDTKEAKANLLDVSKAETLFEEEIARKVNEIIEKMDKGGKENE